MKICEKCKAQMEDSEQVCSICNLSGAVKQSEKKSEVKPEPKPVTKGKKK